jgi:excisionase family DNA binding protein
MRMDQTVRATMTIEEVAAVLGLARSTAYDLAKSDRLPVPVIRAGNRIFVSRRLVERVLAGEVVREQSGTPTVA